MGIKRGVLLAAVLLAAGAGVAFWWAKSASAPKKEIATIFFSGDTQGRLVPCGCFTGQNGGLTRLKTYLTRNATDVDIKLDVGDAIAGAEDYQRIQYKYILQAYRDMGYDALNMGHREAQLTLDQLRAIKSSSPVTLISANLVDKETSKPVFDSCKIITRKGTRIGIIGVVDPQGVGGNLGKGLQIQPMENTLEQLIPQLRKEVAVIVILAFTDEDGLSRLANQFYEANLILGGKVSQPSQRLIKVNRSTILYTANESRTVGSLKAQISPRFEPLEFEMVLLHDKIPEDVGIVDLAKQYRSEVRSTHLDIDDMKRFEADLVPGVKSRSKFVGTDACISCHKEAGKVWNQTQHSHAFASLVEKGADADPNCIGCHTIGFGRSSGYRREYQGTKLVNVSCETCHGPGSLHVEERKASNTGEFKFRPLGAGDCVTCHYGEFSRPFDWATFWPKIQHGKEPQSTAAIQSK